MVEATNTQRLVQKAWLGGMNTFAADDAVGQDQAVLLENISLMERVHAVQKISGSRKYNKVFRDVAHEDDTVIENMFSFTKQNGTAVQLLQASDPLGFFIATFTESSFTEITAATIGVGLSITDWVSYAGKIYFVTGENAVFTWDGVSATYTKTILPLTFSPTIIEMYNGRAYYAGDSVDPSRVLFSKPLLPSDFNTPLADFVDVNDSLGDGIIDLKGLGSSLIVLKKRSLHEIIGSPPREVREIAAIGIGAVHKSTVQKTQVGIVFLSERGVYAYSGGSEPKKLTLNVEPNIETLLKVSQNNYSSVYYNNVYHLFFQSTESLIVDKGVSVALDTLEFNVLGITTLDNFNCKYNIVLSSFDANNDWLCALDGTNVVLKMNNTDYPFYYVSEAEPAVGLTSTVVTKWEDFGDPTKIKDIRSLHFTTQAPLVDMCYTLELFSYGGVKRVEACIVGESASTWDGALGTEGTAIWNGFNWEPANKYQYKVILPSGSIAERVRLKLVSSNTNEMFSLMSVEYHAIPRRGI